jgi:hypothetical protein
MTAPDDQATGSISKPDHTNDIDPSLYQLDAENELGMCCRSDRSCGLLPPV